MVEGGRAALGIDTSVPGAANTQVPERLPWLGDDWRVLAAATDSRRCRHRCRQIRSVHLG